VKYLGLVGGVTLPMQLVNTGAGINDMMAQEAKNKALALMNICEHALPFADSRIVPENFNGLFSQHETESNHSATYNSYMTSDLVIDCKGKILTDEVIEQGSQTVVNNFGLATTLISHPAVFSNYNKRYYDKKFIRPIPEDVRNGVFGQRVNEIWTQNGGIEILQSNFFRNGLQAKKSNTQPTSTKSPAAPTSVTAVATTSTFSKFVAAEAGNYKYAVATRNRYGESALTLVGPEVAVAAGQGVDLTITDGNGYYATTGYSIYRTEVNPVAVLDTDYVFYKIFEVGVQAAGLGYDGAAAGQVRDNNRYIANTDQAILVEWDADQVFALKQLAPMMKLALAVTAPINRFMVLLYTTPILYAPQKLIRYINIGRSLV
jgi:hypothetical protein